MKRLALLFMKNPALPWGLFALGGVWGAIALFRIPLSLLPVSQPTGLTVRLEHPGSDSESVERRLTLPLETAASGLENLVRMESVSENGRSQVHLTFAPGTDLGPVTAELRRRLANLESRLPSDAQKPVVYPLTPDGGADLVMVFGSGDGSNGDLPSLRRRLDRELKPRLEREESVARVDLTGGNRPEVWARADGGDLATRGISPMAIAKALDLHGHVDGPVGLMNRGTLAIPVEITVRPRTLAALEKWPAMTATANAVGLGSLASWQWGARGEEEVSTEDGAERPTLYLTLRPGPGTLAAAGRLTEILKSWAGDDVKCEIIRDKTRALRKSLWELVAAVVLSMAVSVALVKGCAPGRLPILPLLLSFPGSILPSIAMLEAAGGTLNAVSLSGLSLGSTVALDAHLVVLALSTRSGFGHRSRLRALGRIFPPLAASLGASAIIFIPLFALKGEGTGAFRDLAWGFFPCLAFSLIYALTLTAHLIRGREQGKKIPRLMTRVTISHRRILGHLWRRHFLVTGSMTLLGVSTAIIAPFLVKAEDAWSPREPGVVTLYFEFSPDSTGEKRLAAARGIEGRIKNQFPQVRRMSARHEGTRVEWTVHTDLRHRELDGWATEVVRQYGQGYGGFMHRGGAGEGGGEGWVSLIEVTGEDPAVVRSVAQEGARRLSARPWCQEVLLHWREGRPTVRLTPDGRALGMAGLTGREGGEHLRARFFGPVVGKFLDPAGMEHDIRLNIHGPAIGNHRDLAAIFMAGTNGGGLSFGSGYALDETLESTRRSRLGRKPVERFSVRSKYEGGNWKEDRDRVLDGVPLPPGVRMETGADERARAEGRGEIAWAVAAAVVLVYMWLASIQGSPTGPLAILAVLVPAGCGGIWGLFLTGRPMGSGALLGFLMLAGLAVNGAILMEDALKERKGSRKNTGHSPQTPGNPEDKRGESTDTLSMAPGSGGLALCPRRDSLGVFVACRQRLPTAVLTGTTFLVGLVPLLIIGEGPVASLAVVLFFGTLAASAASLILLPWSRLPVPPREIQPVHGTALDRFWWRILRPHR